MSASIVLRPEAQLDIAEALSWYEEQGGEIGDSFLAAIEDIFQRIRNFPQGYGVEYRQVRAAPLHRFPYVVFYRLIGDAIQVVAVMHGRRHSRQWRSRL
jgi:plasmid stabilization system protein ParE